MTLCGGLPADLPAAVLVCLHVSNQRSHLARILTRSGPLTASHAVDGDVLVTGHIYVAPPGHHLVVERGRARLAFGAPENGHRPSIDVLFRTAALTYGPRVIGVVLTGRLDDGAAGLAIIKRRGGIAVVQDPESAAFPDMPRAALAATTVDHTAALAAIPALLAGLVGEPRPARPLEPDLPPSREVDIGPSGEVLPASQTPVGSTHPDETPALLSCPACHGALWRSETGEALQFRCRVGHAYTEASMVSGQDGAVDTALWTAMRALEEQHDLLDRLAGRARARGSERVAKRFAERAALAGESARQIRAILKKSGQDDPLD